MNPKWERLATPLLLAAGTAPLPVLLGCGNGVPQLMLMPLAYLLAAGVCMLLPGKHRLLVAIALSMGILAAGIAGLPQVVVLVTALAYTILLFATLPARDALTYAAVFGGLCIHTLAQIYLNLMEKAMRDTVYSSAQTPLLISLIIFLAVALMTLNGYSLVSAMPDGKGVPQIIRRRNRAIIWMMLGTALLISLIPTLRKLLESLWEWLRQAVNAVIRWLFSLQAIREVTDSKPDSDTMNMSILGEGTPPSAFALWMERILLGLTAVVVVVLLAWAVKKLWKKLCVLVRWLFHRLQSYAASVTEDYVDEVQDTRTQGKEHYVLTRTRQHRVSARELAALPPRERIRAHYGQLRAKHPEWLQSHTARETLNDHSAHIYERARYSDHEVTEQEAGEFLK
ncbi:MAG: hypothetical protein E7319_06580 [Clostridiales bacterium]|nr:hypothetical protein [Clostridiales bacterium]